MNNSFFAILFRQRYIKRWGLMRNTREETLEEHAAETAMLAHALASIGNELFGRQYNADRAVTLALFHDATEVYTGDMPTPVKYYTPEIRESYKRIESEAARRLCTTLPDELRHVYEPIICGHGESTVSTAAANKHTAVDDDLITPDAVRGIIDGDSKGGETSADGSADARNTVKDRTSVNAQTVVDAQSAVDTQPAIDAQAAADASLGRIVKAADSLSAYIKCLGELGAGNTEFEDAAASTRQKLERMNMPELDWFMENMLEAFTVPLDRVGF